MMHPRDIVTLINDHIESAMEGINFTEYDKDCFKFYDSIIQVSLLSLHALCTFVYVISASLSDISI